MIIRMYSVYDTKAAAFLQPFFFRMRGEAIRAFGNEANSRTSMIGKHPGDYLLFELGDFDDNTGKFTPADMPLNLGPAAQYVVVAPPSADLFATAQEG